MKVFVGSRSPHCLNALIFAEGFTLNYLKSVVNSKVNHLYGLKEYKTTDPFKETEDGKIAEELLEKADPSSDHASNLVQQTLNPEEELVRKENEEEIINLVFEAIEGYEDLQELVTCLMSGILKSGEIAEEMGREINDVYNLKRKLRRKLTDLL